MNSRDLIEVGIDPAEPAVDIPTPSELAWEAALDALDADPISRPEGDGPPVYSSEPF